MSNDAAKKLGLATGDLNASQKRDLYRQKFSAICTLAPNAKLQFTNIVSFLATAPDAMMFLFAELTNLESVIAALRHDLETEKAQNEFLEKEIERLRSRLELKKDVGISQPAMRAVSKPLPAAPASPPPRLPPKKQDQVRELPDLLEELDDLDDLDLDTFDAGDSEPETSLGELRPDPPMQISVMEEYDRRTKELSQWLRLQLDAETKK